MGVIRTTLCDFWTYEAVVNRWPHFEALVLRPNWTNCRV